MNPAIGMRMNEASTCPKDRQSLNSLVMSIPHVLFISQKHLQPSLVLQSCGCLWLTYPAARDILSFWNQWWPAEVATSCQRKIRVPPKGASSEMLGDPDGWLNLFEHVGYVFSGSPTLRICVDILKSSSWTAVSHDTYSSLYRWPLFSECWSYTDRQPVTYHHSCRSHSYPVINAIIFHDLYWITVNHHINYFQPFTIRHFPWNWWL